jgi:hypothetical protein
MTAVTTTLTGQGKTVIIDKTSVGSAGIGGTFRLQFRGSSTEDIPVSATALQMTSYLTNIDTIAAGGVTVNQLLPDFNIAGGEYDRMWSVTFASAELGGDVETLEVPSAYNHLTGSDIQIDVHNNGLETSNERRSVSTVSLKGNQISGEFTLTFRNHTTAPIPFLAADTVMKAAVEALPNIGTVAVKRTGPSVRYEYVWSITFLSMPGSFPIGSWKDGDAKLEPTYTDLAGTSSNAAVARETAGSTPLDGLFSLQYANTSSNWQVASGIPVDASASELGEAINALKNTGTVSVSRTVLSDGYTWLVTFDGCKIVNGVDVCNHGNVFLMMAQSENSTNTCPISVVDVIPGSGPSECTYGPGGKCYDDVVDLSGGEPYSYKITSLTAGTPYYVRVSAHNRMGFGYPALTEPEYETPTYLPPGAPPMVRLESSTDTSISVVWDEPRENGGADVKGYELWMDDWSGGNERLIYDGTDAPTTYTFTVDTSSSFGVRKSNSYRFRVRAMNYCIATDASKACYGEFSDASVFAVRAPRAPLAPPMPYRSSKSELGTSGSRNDAQITIRWEIPVDNGGDPITEYSVWVARPNEKYNQIHKALESNFRLDTIDSDTNVNANLIMEYTYTGSEAGGVFDGSIYRFYVRAHNDFGVSPGSPVVSIVAGIYSGIDSNTQYIYSALKPVPRGVDAGEITVSWPLPSTNSTGGTPVTGFQVFMYPGVGLNTLVNPQQVFQEVQVVKTTVAEMRPEVHTIKIEEVISGNVLLSLNGKSEPVSIIATASDIFNAIDKMYPGFCSGYTVSDCVDKSTYNTDESPSPGTKTGTQWVITYKGVDLPVEPIAVDATGNSAYSSGAEYCSYFCHSRNGSTTYYRFILIII